MTATAGAIDLSALARDAVPAPVLARLTDARNALVVSHENPDADTLGAVIGVCMVLEAFGARATAVCTDPVPPLYSFLAGIERFRTDPDPAETYDLLVLCDCGSADRVGAVAQRHPELFSALPRVIIAHHASNSDGGDADWIEPVAG